MYSYNRYLAVAARVVRRSLKEQPRLQAERRGEMDLKFAKWQVSIQGSWKILGTDVGSAIERQARREQEPGERERECNGGGRRTRSTIKMRRKGAAWLVVK